MKQESYALTFILFLHGCAKQYCLASHITISVVYMSSGDLESHDVCLYMLMFLRVSQTGTTVQGILHVGCMLHAYCCCMCACCRYEHADSGADSDIEELPLPYNSHSVSDMDWAHPARNNTAELHTKGPTASAAAATSIHQQQKQQRQQSTRSLSIDSNMDDLLGSSDLQVALPGAAVDPEEEDDDDEAAWNIAATPETHRQGEGQPAPVRSDVNLQHKQPSPGYAAATRRASNHSDVSFSDLEDDSSSIHIGHATGGSQQQQVHKQGMASAGVGHKPMAQLLRAVSSGGHHNSIQHMPTLPEVSDVSFPASSMPSNHAVTTKGGNQLGTTVTGSTRPSAAVRTDSGVSFLSSLNGSDFDFEDAESEIIVGGDMEKHHQPASPPSKQQHAGYKKQAIAAPATTGNSAAMVQAYRGSTGSTNTAAVAARSTANRPVTRGRQVHDGSGDILKEISDLSSGPHSMMGDHDSDEDGYYTGSQQQQYHHQHPQQVQGGAQSATSASDIFYRNFPCSGSTQLQGYAP